MNISGVNENRGLPTAAHLTSAHPRSDPRILLKMCASLSNNGYQTSLIVADGMGYEKYKGICIHDVGSPSGRIDRILNAPKRVFNLALALDADIYHLHDPELIPIGLKLKRRGKKVIFDSHEDVPKQLLGKRYLPPLLLRALSLIFAVFERFACSGFDAIVGATPHISEKFLKFNARSIAINNFPIIGELEPSGEQNRQSAVVYIGAITEMRGIREMVNAIGCAEADVRLSIAGKFSEKELAEEMRKSSGWKLVDEVGYLDREGVRDLLSRSSVGLVTLHPSINYIDALPIKMFEYMSAGVPVISSDFPLWREIIDGNNCGICVDPLDPAAIAAAIDTLINDQECARQMGQNGQKAIKEKYNWSVEEMKLLNLYENLISGHP